MKAKIQRTVFWIYPSPGPGIMLFALLLAGLTGTVRAQKAPALEYQVKAVFLFNFSQFVEWPEGSFARADSPFMIGVLGENPFEEYLKETVAGEKKGTHAIRVEHYPGVRTMKPCHILFVHPRLGVPLKEVIPPPMKGILTVSDAPDFIHQGGMIRFYTQDGKIRLQINPEAAKEAGLTISSKLLRLADIYTP